jgi:phage terminase small subunit
MKAPEHLSEHSRRTWKRIQREYVLGPDASDILRCALENFDLAQSARQLIQQEGLIVSGRRNRAVDIASSSYSLYLRSMRQLGLDIAEPGPIGRPTHSVS